MKYPSNIYQWLIIAFVSILLSWMTYSLFYNTNIELEQRRFQKEFNQLEEKQKSFKNTLTSIVKSNSIEKLWENEELKSSPFYVLCYQDDSLIYWNNNQLLFHQKYAGSHSYFVGKLQNGYYLVDKFKVHDIQVYIASKLKDQFFYQNKALQNKISNHFSTTSELVIDFKKTNNNFPVLSLDKSELFFVTILKTKAVGKYQQLIIFGLYLLGFTALIIGFTFLIYKVNNGRIIGVILYPIALLVLRYFSIQNSWIQLFDDFEIFEPNLYANSNLIPNLGSFILSLPIIFAIIWWSIKFIKEIKEATKTGSFILTVLYFVTLAYALFISHIFESLIVNSSIPLVIDEVFSLNVYSFIALFIISFLFLSYYFLIRQVSVKILNSKIPLPSLALLWFFSSIIFIGFEFFYFEHSSFHATWPIILNGLFLYIGFKEHRLNELKYNLLIVFVISFYGAVSLLENNQQNERQKRELYANQLITDQDPTMEIEYLETIDKLINNPEFYQLLEGANYFSAPNFALQIENCCFGSFWERYEIEFFFFNEDGNALFEYISGQNRTREEFLDIINKHSIESEIAEDLHFVADYFNQLSYIGHQKVTTFNNDSVDFFVLFKSKKIPESIGFPRLLMNEKSYALQDLEDYSIARYSKDKLVMRFGNYNYPTNLESFKNQNFSKGQFVTIDHLNHLIYLQEDGQGVIISKPEKRFIEKLSTFSYLVLFFGVFSLIVLGLYNWESMFTIKYSQLTFKVQSVLIGMVIVTFTTFAIVSIKNVTRQYNVNTVDNIEEKMSSIEIVLNQRIGDKVELSTPLHGDYLNYILKRLSNVFVTDINFYSTNGHLFATSQAKIYDKGISTRIMNDLAYYSLNYQKKSEYIHHEQFGNLSFLSGYIPFRNNDGKLLGYINLQHFSKQNVFERQMNEFIVAVINVAVLLLVISVLLAIIVSGWITTPLRLIQQNFSKVEFGKENKPINYKADDEIGALVKDYNNKLVELELTAMQLAKTERETAWREMAKQIAHEIKNPLTPMKLSVQHFQRSFDPESPNAKEKIQRMVSSLIEQIDALTNIANEFSNFAKMPKANEENLDLVPLIESVRDLYSSPEVEINLLFNSENTIDIFADKDLILRVFNNLIKNAIQAQDSSRSLRINIDVETKDKHYIISVQDNGLGIPEDIRDKMFVPNFTTKTTGSGLGLAMVKQIITTHNGEIWFESKIDVGTTFYIKLPKNY